MLTISSLRNHLLLPLNSVSSLSYSTSVRSTLSGKLRSTIHLHTNVEANHPIYSTVIIPFNIKNNNIKHSQRYLATASSSRAPPRSSSSNPSPSSSRNIPGKGTSTTSASSITNTNPSSSLRPIINEAINFPQVRVLDGKNNLGVLSRTEALQIAKQKQLDLVLFVPTATPPICRLILVKDYIKEIETKQQKENTVNEEKNSAKKEENKVDRKQKEIRLTARTDDHDLGVKTGKIIEFLKHGHSVKITISFTLSAWQKEEPARREVLAKIVRRVAESGIGWIDPSSISGQGANLLCTCNPVNHPKNKADWDKVLLKLTTPLNSLGNNDVRAKAILPTVAAAVDGTAKGSTITDILPPTELLLKTYRSPKAHNGRIAHSSVATGTDLKKEEENKDILADPDLPSTGGRRRRRPTDAEDTLPMGRQRRSSSSKL